MGVKVTNNAYGTISAGISSSDTTITLDTGQGARFPTLGAGDYFYATLVDTANNIEVVKVTARSTDSMTAVRASDNTVARSFSIGDRFELRPTAALFDSKANDDEVVKTTGGQTIEGVLAVEGTAGNNDSTFITRRTDEAGFSVLPWTGGNTFFGNNIKYVNGSWLYYGESTGKNPSLLGLSPNGINYYNCEYADLSGSPLEVAGSWTNGENVSLFDKYGMPSRGVIQTVATTFTGSFQVSSAAYQTYTATGHTASITLKSDNSKVLVVNYAQGYTPNGGGHNTGIRRRVDSGSWTQLIGVSGGSGDSWMGIANGLGQTSFTINRAVLDNHGQAKGAVLTYEAMIANWTSTATVYYNYPGYAGTCTFIVMEIAT